MKTPDQFAADDAAFLKQYTDEQAEKEQQKSAAPDAFRTFMTDPGHGPVPDKVLMAAVRAADGLGTLAHPIYQQVRDSVVAFSMHNQPGKVDNAIARLCIPLVGYARMLGRVRTIAHGAQIYADNLVTPEKTSFIDLHLLGEHTLRYFTDALGTVDHHAHIDYVNFVSGALSEESLDAQLRKHVKPVQAAVLTLAAAVLRDGIRATKGAMLAGAKSTDDLMPHPTGYAPRGGRFGHGLYLKLHAIEVVPPPEGKS